MQIMPPTPYTPLDYILLSLVVIGVLLGVYLTVKGLTIVFKREQ